MQRSEKENGACQVPEAIRSSMDAVGKTPASVTADLKQFYNVEAKTLPVIYDRAGNALPPHVLAYLLTAHEKTEPAGPGRSDDGYGLWRLSNGSTVKTWAHPGLRPEAEAAVKALDSDSLQKALPAIMNGNRVVGNSLKQNLIYPLCRYADEQTAKEILENFLFRGEDRCAVCCSNTHTAMMWADRHGLLKEYAEFRGLKENQFRIRYFSDPGLDEQGRHVFDLGGPRIAARLQSDLRYTLEREDGTVIKSVPKKKADPVLYEKAKAGLAVLKKETRQIGKSNAEALFADFLSGQTVSGREWRTFYPVMPLLARLGRLLVWSQQEQTFILGADGRTCGADGTEYTVTDSPVKVAHPMEMGPALTAKWQEYFLKNSLKQPFEQVWEPVADVSLVKPGRYDGCAIPLFALMNREKHGIRSERGYHIELEDCMATPVFVRAGSGHGASSWVFDEYELRDFRFSLYTRRVNHIVSLLDRETVAGRIRKDDISVRDWLDLFTLPQILGFIGLAAESGAVNVSALLLEYKKNRFGETDIMDEFTLDLI